MPSRADTPDKRMLQAAIYMGQNQSEEAAKLLERTLLTSINDVQMVMYKLIDANVSLGDNEAAAYVAERVTRLAEAFDLNLYNTVVAPFQVAVANKDVTQTIALLKKMLDAMSETWCIQASPLYRRVATNDTGTSMKKMVGLLLHGLRQAPEYAYLQDNDDFQALLTEYEGKA